MKQPYPASHCLIFLFPAKPSKPLCWLMCREGAATPLENSRKDGSSRLVTLQVASSHSPLISLNVRERRAGVSSSLSHVSLES